MMRAEIIIPTLNPARATETARHAVTTAGVESVPHIIVDNERRGFTRTVNQGLRSLFEVDYIVLLNDDVRMSENWLFRLIFYARKFSALFAGPSGACRTPPQCAGRPGDQRSPRIVSHVAGFCLLADWRALEKSRHRYLDQRFRHYGSDVDWQWRSGGRSVWVPSVWCAHELHAPREPWWTQDQNKLIEIWGGK